MNIQLIKREDQADGNFNNGDILEKKPIGFPQDGGKNRPYSNLFYWAHAWTPNVKSTIGLHPHQGFDTKQDKWISLKKGDVQIIRAGNGISHAEELNEKSEIFQIWFDPNIQISMKKEATYNDYKSDDFEIIDRDGIKIKRIAGIGSPMKIFSEGIEINSYKIHKKSKLHLELKKDSVYSYFILEGEAKINNDLAKKGDFIIISECKELSLSVYSMTKIFEIKSPLRPSYKTYSERFTK